MSSLHEKMQVDYTWIRNNPASDEKLRQRLHGYHYLYNKAPNGFERLEMIYRSMGKQFDWELERFRLAKKPIDRANKRRIWKTGLRFMKNPLGYIYWKTYRNNLLSFRGRWVVRGMIVTFIFLAARMWQQSQVLNRAAATDLHFGKIPEGRRGRTLGFADHKSYRSTMKHYSWAQYELQAHMLTMNPTWKQNLMKEMQLLKANNITA